VGKQAAQTEQGDAAYSELLAHALALRAPSVRCFGDGFIVDGLRDEVNGRPLIGDVSQNIDAAPAETQQSR